VMREWRTSEWVDAWEMSGEMSVVCGVMWSDGVE
jgi:hypothetical protein